MSEKVKVGIIGCGDYIQRWEAGDINDSSLVDVKLLFDLDSEKANTLAAKIGGTVANSSDAIFADPEIQIVFIFTPPFVRKALFQKAVDAGKHIITTKPFGSNLADAEELVKIVDGKVNCSVFYGRSGNANVEKIKEVLASGEIGHLALYKEDWLHHYPTWNDWATDPEKNGGPFMDAMVHNLNKSRYFIGSKVKKVTYFSENYAQELKCNDTEWMKLDFENGATSLLFITWAADLEVFDQTGNDRVHLGIPHLITNQGWYMTEEEVDGKPVIKAVKETEVKTWDVTPLAHTKYDEFVICMQEGKKQPFDASDALIDMQVMADAVKQV